jgi:small subunit ribosomal protein S16
MPVKIRLSRQGRKKQPFYNIVIADARAPRDGKFIERIGSYNPMTSPATIELDVDKAYEWMTKGAQPTHTARAILRFKGVLYKKHLQRGVTKGALSQEKADELLTQWMEAKDAKVQARIEESIKERENYWKRLSGEVKAVTKKEDTTAAAEAFQADDAPAEVVADATEATADAAGEEE